MGSRRGVLGLLLAIGALTAAPAQASTTIGADLSDPFFAEFNCDAVPSGCTMGNGPLLPFANRAPGGLVAPISGVIVRWRIKIGPLARPTALRIMRPGNMNTRAAVATSAAVTPPTATTSTFDTRLPIAAGDTVGVDSKLPPYGFVASNSSPYWNPALADGTTPSPPSGLLANSELLVNADLEADIDSDGYGDETQDGCPLDSSTHDRCLLTVSIEGGGRVTGPGIDCPGDCSEAYAGGTAVHLVSDPDKGFAAAGYESTGAQCTGGFSVCDLTMAKNASVKAIFHDDRSPQTKITKGPKPTTSKRKVKIRFRSNERPQKFQCALDKKKFVGFCKSPYEARVKPGKHVFRVRAVDAVHRVDSTPAKVRFEVLP